LNPDRTAQGGWARERRR